MVTIILLLGLAIFPVFGRHEIFDGPCPFQQVDTIQDFKHEEFQGIWYVIRRYSQSSTMDCVLKGYSWKSESRSFDELAYEESFDHGIVEWVVLDIPERERFSNNGKFFFPTTNRDYYFVDTDYYNYAVSWTCDEVMLEGKLANRQNLMVIARDRAFDINSMESLNATLAKEPFDRNKLKYIEQLDENCYKQQPK